MKIAISQLKKDGLQLRESLSEDMVAEYAEAMRNGAVFPPVTVFKDPKKPIWYLADGFHRVESALRAGKTTIEAEQRIGDYYAAEAYACGANASAPRSSETKKRCVIRLWEHRKQHFGKNDPSDREIANLAHISRTYVNSVLNGLATSGQLVLPKTVTGKDGVTRTRPMPPVRPPVRQPVSPQVRPPVRPAPPVRKGYVIGRDGKEHAIGVELDRFNVEVPEKIKQAFLDPRLNDWANTISRVKCDIQNARELGVTFAASVARAEIELDNAFHELKAAVPYCVCRMCQGQGCKACHETGYQTKAQYDRNPAEFKCHQAE